MSGFTPMIEQYRNIKKEYADCILFFRLGDFYEMFFEDAELASRELDIVLTARDGGQCKVPMCGVPYHAATGYIGKLLEKGYRVAVCDQMEDPALAKGIVKREVTRVVTPGTALDDAWLKEDNNYLTALLAEEELAALAYVDVSTGEFGACQFTGSGGIALLRDELARLRPRECLVPQWSKESTVFFDNNDFREVVITETAPELFTAENAKHLLQKYFGSHALNVSGLERMPVALKAAGAILGFIEETQRTYMSQIKYIRTYHVTDYLGLDQASRKNLELTAGLREGKHEGSLLAVIDYTRTAMGKRQLRKWLEQPLLDCHRIDERLDAVEELLNQRNQREDLQNTLQNVRDLERVAARIGAGVLSPREALALKSSLEMIPFIREFSSSFNSPLLITLLAMNDLPPLREMLEKAIDDNAPVSTREGGIIKTGFNEQVDELRRLAFAGDQWLLDYEKSEKERTGIKSLKVGYNKVFGYYLEVTRANADQVPPEYTRKQTLVNAERYITQELKHFENEVLGAKEKLYALELELYQELREQLKDYIMEIQTLAMQLSQLDSLASLAEAAFRYGYTRPVVNREGKIAIKGGRHPVVEKALGDQRFVPNDTNLDSSAGRLGIITGPNMGGKSTYLRQVALIVILAQIGSFVPADQAVIGLVDRIFTRVGASDDISSGHSTFMVEMVEVANILRYASPQSLVLLDEVGRGTSTFDGMSIARALTEYLIGRSGMRVLFATHYHELTDLSDSYPGIFNLCVSVKESGDEVIFLKKVLQGKADKSYGIHVARLAGLPAEVTERANRILDELESGKNKKQGNELVQMSLFGEESHPIIQALKGVDVNRLTPMDALSLLQRWTGMLAENE